MHVVRRLIFVILLTIIVFLGVIRPQIVAVTSTGHDRELYDVSVLGSVLGSM